MTGAQPLATNATPAANAPGDPSTRLTGGWLMLVRAAWVIVIVWTLLLFSLAIPAMFNDSVVQASTARNGLAQLGLSAAGNAALRTGFAVAATLISLGMGAFLFWRRSDDWMVLLVSFVFITVAPGMEIALRALGLVQPVWQAPVVLQFGLGLIATALLVFTFPTGRFVPAWTQPAFILFASLVFAYAGVNIAQHSLSDPAAVWVVCYGLGVTAQIYRQRRTTSAIQRQQFRWIVFGFFLYAPTFALFSLLSAVVAPTWPEAQRILFGLWGAPLLFYIPALLLFMTAVVATLRYRLWDIDLLIRRTLIYGLLTAALALIYFGSVVLLQGLFGAVTGQQSQLAIILSTLAIAALAVPLRGRIQEVIDRRFYRRKYDAARVLQAFGTAIRDEVDLAALNDRLVAVLDETLRPEHASVWLKESTPENNSPAQAGGTH